MADQTPVSGVPIDSANIIPNQSDPFAGLIGISSKFATLNKLITRDLNTNARTPSFTKYTKDDIQKALENPAKNEDILRDAVIYIYSASPHFRRLIQYFAGLTDLAYIISPYKLDPKKANVNSVNRNYRKVANLMASMMVRSQFPDIITTCLREDTYYGTMWVTSDNITIQNLPSKYCAISSIEGNVFNVTFDFSYFNSYSEQLEYYPKEFSKKYELYKNDRRGHRWQELDSPTSFAIKCNRDITQYSVPPFVGLLREIYDLEDYKSLKETKVALENYAMLVMTLPMNDDGSWGIDLPKAKS